MSVDDRLGPGWLVVRVGGQLVPADRVGPVTIRHGRASAVDAAQPGTVSLTLDRAALAALPVVGDALSVELSDAALAALGATAAQADAARVRFAGDVTDAQLLPRMRGLSLLSIVGVGPAARIGQETIGDQPWPDELDGARAQRILQLADAAVGLPLGTVDPGAVTVMARDVDSQPPLALLDELGLHTGGRLHLSRDGALSWHDALHRRNAPTLVELTAANVLRDTGWRQDKRGLVNDARLTYGPAPTVEGEPQPSVRVVDQPSIDRHGRAPVRIGTQLLDQADALELARQLVGRRSRPRWRIDALTVELLRTLTPAQSTQLLTAEPGDLLSVAGFPDSGPDTHARLFAEGWTETCSRHGWLLALDVVSYSLAGASPRWVDVDPRTRWADVPPDLTWQQAIGWHTQADLGRWLDQPSSLRWADVDPAATWQSYPTAAT